MADRPEVAEIRTVAEARHFFEFLAFLYRFDNGRQHRRIDPLGRFRLRMQ